ncbi:RNA polymerase sigma-70 factor [Pedobacter nutrimenti]|uniref:RNA polymerase sigma-70 factor n=1 Tax=Pedobacter nutrimenti TaxID=1241337 RepID=UPI00292E6293|nr:RNA polymerase sigma-70 factor [Pedobacter nutrimenti]
MTIKTFLNESDLLGQIAVKNQHAFKIIYDKFHRKVYTFSLKYVKSEIQAEEIVQEVFLKLWQMKEAVLSIKNLDRFLLTLTRNRALDIIRRKELETRVNIENGKAWKETHNDTEELILLKDTRKVLEEAVNLLPQQQKLVYQLCHQEGLKYDEAAKQLNISPQTVHSHMKLALRFLRSYLRDHTDVTALVIIFKLLH